METHAGELGVTLIELMVVITIIGILAGMITTGSLRVDERARMTKTQVQMAQMETALETYRGDFLKYPWDAAPAGYEDDNAYVIEQLSGMSRTTGAPVPGILNDPNWNGPYLELKRNDILVINGERVWVDAWGSPFHLRIAADMAIANNLPPFNRPLTYDLWSDGANRTAESGTDAATGLGGDDLGNF